MPYKSQQKRTEAVQKHRAKGLQQGITEGGITQGITADGTEMVPASYVEGKEGKIYEFLPERPRHLILSDGQALDRAAQPKTKKTDRGMVASNEAYSYVKDKGRAERYKLWKEGREQTHPAMYAWM